MLKKLCRLSVALSLMSSCIDPGSFCKAQSTNLPPQNGIGHQYFVAEKDIVWIEADEYSGFYRNCIILRKADKYAVAGVSGNIIIPYGKYLFNMVRPPIGESSSIHDRYGLVVRSPESGLYGMVDINKPDKELIPCEYNTVSNFYKNIDAAVGERFDKNGLKKKFFLTLDGIEVPYKEGITFDPKKPSRYVPLRNDKGPQRLFYDIWEDKVYAQSPHVYRYYGYDLYRIDSAFNDLRKFGFVNHEGKMVIPYQIDYNHDITPFQDAGTNPSKAVSVLSGHSNAHYKYALMDTLGTIYAQIGEGGALKSIDLKDMNIIHGYLDLNVDAKAFTSKECLWDVFNNKITNVNQLFEKANSRLLSNFKQYTFIYRGRNEWGIKFEMRARIPPGNNIYTLFPNAKPYNGGGFQGNVDSRLPYDFSGYGFMDYSGNIIALPIFNKLALPDIASGLAYAEMECDKQVYKGFIHAETGKFEILFK